MLTSYLTTLKIILTLRNKTRQQITIKVQIFITINNSIKNGVTKIQCNKQQ